MSPDIAVDTPVSQKQSGIFPKLLIFLLIILFLGGLVFVSLTSQFKPLKNTKTISQPMQLVLQSGKLLIGSDTTYPPMEYLDNKNMFAGYDIDLGNKIAQSMGLTAEFKTIPFDDIFNQLTQKKYDIIISSITITDERKAKYDFSDPYLNAGEVIIARRDDTMIKSPANLAGKKVGVQKGTTEEAEAPKHTTPNLVIVYPDNNPALVDLVNGKIDAVLTDLPNAKGIITKNPTLKIASDPFTNEQYGIVFRKGEKQFETKVNSILTQLNQNGYLTNLTHKWLE